MTKTVLVTVASSLMLATPAVASGASHGQPPAESVFASAYLAEGTEVDEDASRVESLTTTERKVLNDGLSVSGAEPVGANVTDLRYNVDGSVDALTADGEVDRVIISAIEPSNGISFASPQKGFVTQGLVHPEVKRIIGACLGFGSTGGLSFEALVQKYATPQNAVKFVVRRIGVFGAVSCAGSIVWMYI